MENNQGTVTKKKAAGCQDEGDQKFLFLRVVFISTFWANIFGKIQYFGQGHIAENKDKSLYIRGEYKICDHVNIAGQARFEGPRSIAGTIFGVPFVKEKSCA